MLRYNLIAGSLFGLTAVLVGLVFEPSVKAKLDDELVAKAVEIPEQRDEDGNVLAPKKLVISDLDRDYSEQRWQHYELGVRNLTYASFAMLALGLIPAASGRNRLVSRISGGAFTAGVIFYCFGLASSAVFDQPLLAIFSGLGALCLAAGWAGLTGLACISTRE
ncbi:DUF423 domain-containing protein [Blastopirellula sp. JC732]|uniref:DUF423 domain-containing protein n=1 Tax=Blastopirellula sediminis TaxID=2894196 RepID=A0A9X1MJW9_9BACT|nr:DUF423 domain-containing protein [Blastopirellula sediminis]MCC9608705.1 DUF423 domain-containing protein [Blastopirellula sediminis]MCC9628518.1 DUF423 domain-containing protein [Blastopirellula sediminis]